MGIHLPQALTHGPWDAHEQGLINLPATLVILVLGALLLSGAKMSALFNAIIVAIKLAAIAVFIAVAAFHVNLANWHPFIPPEGPNPKGETAYGVGGIFTAASKIFFAYLGFDAVSTAAEETRRPQRDVPIGIIGSLTLCTIIYIVVSGLLTGIAPYQSLNNDHPVTRALVDVGANWAAGLITIGAVAGLTTVMLVMYYGLTRVLLAISRDGLLPGLFSRLNEGGNPRIAIIATGIVMALLGGLVPLDELGDIANIGTLGAFVVACAGMMVLRRKRPDLKRPFRVAGGDTVPVLGILSCGFLMLNLGATTWKSFAVWMSIGLVVYFTYSRRNSVLGQQTTA
jgi:APA family basic amino acid/polyamine antiporter